jgi:predicted esterase
MNKIEKEVSYTISNSYTTLNSLTDKTKNVWLVCHGIGYLSRYFLKYFNELDALENFIIAPQAQSKYYLGSKYTRVGASWLTKENTSQEIRSVMRYLDAVLEVEKFPKSINFIALGYSQGVSVICRYVASRKLKCNQLVLMSGGIPKELEPQNFEFLRGETEVSMFYGTEDEYLNEERLKYEKQLFRELFGDSANIIAFEGKHELKKECLATLIE